MSNELQEVPPASMGLRVALASNKCPDCENGKIYTANGMVLRDFVRIVRFT